MYYLEYDNDNKNNNDNDNIIYYFESFSHQC